MTFTRSAPKGLTFSRASQLLAYCPETGVFVWRVARGGMKSGDRAGSVGGAGYRYISIDDHPYLEHQLAFLLMTGSWPGDVEIDHKDTDKTNNRWLNLRPASHSENSTNRGPASNNTSGHRGVCWSKSKAAWRAYVNHGGRQHHVGYFPDKADAVSARNARAIELHGDFARIAA